MNLSLAVGLVSDGLTPRKATRPMPIELVATEMVTSPDVRSAILPEAAFRITPRLDRSA